MFYTSTRKKLEEITATKAILQGISEDGGLFVPKTLPTMDFKLEEMLDWDYQEIAYRVIRLFFEDMKRRIEANADKTTPEKLLNLAKLSQAQELKELKELSLPTVAEELRQ